MIEEANEEIKKGNIDEVKFILNDIKENSEKIAAFIVLKKDNDLSEVLLKQEIKNKIVINLGESKAPNQIKFLSELPYNESGKLLINQLLNDS